VEVDFCQARKHGQPVCGDVFLSRRLHDENRTLSVLADGLGSGIKANVLATLTGTMALRFVSDRTDVGETARLIMETLPICKERQIGYSTFTIVDIEEDGRTAVIEHDNPPYLLVRGPDVLQPDKVGIPMPSAVEGGTAQDIQASILTAREADRLVIVSDGVTQAGMGRPATPLGWGWEALRDFVVEQVRENPRVSARALARAVVERAVEADRGKAKDDITCAVVYFRQPRRLLLVSGPPFDRQNDSLLASVIGAFHGRKVICGGTTASIVSRELAQPLDLELDDLDSELPPTSKMPGIDLITEGTLTLSVATDILEQGLNPDELPVNPATRLVQLLLDSDVIQFMVGTRINDAHQDPNVPVELDLRRNIVRRLRAVLEERFLKETGVRFL
jgi:hypothetical protein